MENIETENLIGQLDSAKQAVVRLERALDLRELETLKLDEKLHTSQRKCDHLEATIARLLEEKRVSNDLCEKISAENSKISYENQNLTLALQNEKSENERLAGICQEEFKCFDAMVEKLGRLIKGLRRENSDANKTLEELKLENIELRRKKSEADTAAKLYKSSLDVLSPRIGQIEEDLAAVLSMKVGDLATFANEVRELEGFEGEDGDSLNSGDGDLVQPWTIREDDGANAFEDFSKPESNECDKPLESGEHSRGTQLMCRERCFSKSARSSSGARDIIDINVSSDDEDPGGPAGISNKLNRTECMEDCFSNSTTKRKWNMSTCDEDDVLST